jgi:hypothetical protein
MFDLMRLREAALGGDGCPVLGAPDEMSRRLRSAELSPPSSPSQAWALLDALAYLDACIDPSGMLAGQRLRRDR